MWSLGGEHGQFSVVAPNMEAGFMAHVQKQRVTARLAMHFVCSRCKGMMKGTMDSIEKFCDEAEIVNGFCYIGDRLNSIGSCRAAVTARVRIGWIRFRECRDLLLGNKFPLRRKDKVYRCCA